MNRNRLALGVGALAVFAAGALAMYGLDTRAARDNPAVQAPALSSAVAASVPGAQGPGARVLQVSPDLVARAGIRMESVQAGAPGAGLRLPGTVQPNAYRKVSVTPLVGGRVTRVPIELGQHVLRGATLAEINSPDLVDARTRYLSMRADLEVGEARVVRTERLVQIGAASQQELEQIRAEHTRHQAEVDQAAARLRLLGIDPVHVTPAGDADPATATMRVTAPRDGVVLERPATVGMTVEPSTVLAALAELSPVWVIADVYERDLSAVRTGLAARITTDAYPSLRFAGKITYISPEVRSETRTAEVRVEVPNLEGQLRFGMLVMVAIDGAPHPPGAVIPRTAVQTVGTETVVYVVLDQATGRFEERPVALGEGDQERVSVLTGVSPGDRIVTANSFSLRAEAERQGRRPVAAPPAPPSDHGAPVETFEVRVTANGFEPSTLTLHGGRVTRIAFTRTTDETCAKEVVFPDYALRRSLPLNEAVTVEFTPKRELTAGFVCGMNMLKGALIVR